MSSKATDKRLRSRIANTPLFLALCGLVVALAAGTALAGLPKQGKRPPQQALKLGQTKHTPAPLCPQQPSEKRQQKYFDHHPGATTLPQNLQTKHACQAVGSVTGFQIKADGKKQAFRVPHNARIVAWAVSVANTNAFEEKAFGKKLFPSNQYGPDPQAQLAILKKMKHQGPRFKLIRNSPIEKLNSAQGHKQYFVLKKPLKAKKGMIVGITMPTWAPIIASNANIQKNNKWRASRKNCANSDATHARPQLKKKSVRPYKCIFPDRLLYWAYYIRGLGNGHH
jgi:hypothetical protein